MQPERLRREADVRLNQSRLEPNAARGGIDVGAGLSQHCARFVVQKIDPDLFEHGERSLMNGFELVARNKVKRRERRLWLARGLERA